MDRISGRRSFRKTVSVRDRVLHGVPSGVDRQSAPLMRKAWPWLVLSTPMCEAVRASETALCTRVMLDPTNYFSVVVVLRSWSWP